MNSQQVNCYFSPQHPLCHCGGKGDQAVVQDPETGRWYITMWHCGYNTPANNGPGYKSESAARSTIKRYQYKR